MRLSVKVGLVLAAIIAVFAVFVLIGVFQGDGGDSDNSNVKSNTSKND